ncbi:purple acid phosphatase 18-like [Nicotiana tabacum]|uniref:Purple acid phosphatase n=1 Tax=Nicotiana tabacum TaxID=4097 RepID=A0A1S3ZN56_TOBAC|nr:PREDICTED: purple acid phosphatase 18-like [Nicotiana tabacum]
MELNVKIIILQLLSLTAVLFIGATVRAGEVEYVRPPPRNAFRLPWDPKPSSQPQQVHISLAGDKHIRVSWVTTDKSSLSVIEYGTSTGKYSFKAQGESTKYSYLLYSSGTIHHTVIGPLQDNTVYFYRCGGEGPEFQLKTPPSKFPVTFAVAGDLGQTGWTKSTLDHIDQCKYDVHLLPGDLSYADYIQHRWDTFGQLVQPLASARPWMVTQGNHEKENIPFIVDEFISYNSRWKMPFEESGSTSNLYYSFDVAGVHTIMLGSYTDYDEYSDQYRWLKADLLKVNRKKTPWLVVLFHVPWYNSNEAHQGEADDMMATMEPLLYAGGADIVFAGHVHAYERTKRVYNGRPDPCGAVHITIGDGGNKEGLARKYKLPQPEWSVFREASFGHGELAIINSTHASWSWHRNDDDEPVRSDQVQITSLIGSGCSSVAGSHELRKILVDP